MADNARSVSYEVVAKIVLGALASIAMAWIVYIQTQLVSIRTDFNTEMARFRADMRTDLETIRASVTTRTAFDISQVGEVAALRAKLEAVQEHLNEHERSMVRQIERLAGRRP